MEAVATLSLLTCAIAAALWIESAHERAMAMDRDELKKHAKAFSESLAVPVVPPWLDTTANRPICSIQIFSECPIAYRLFMASKGDTAPEAVMVLEGRRTFEVVGLTKRREMSLEN